MRWASSGLLGLITLAALLALAACETRPPIGQAEAESYGEDWQRREGVYWGSPIEVLPPALADAGGHRWWQLRYPDVPGGTTGDRLLLVDSLSGWAQRPFPGYAARIPAADAKPSSQHPLTVQEGPWIVVVVEPAELAPEAAAALEREATRLNALGSETGLYPLFSVRVDRRGRSSLVYGWQGDRGIQREARVGDWLQARTPYGAGAWVDLRE
jgi:hypothetical protein